MSHILARFPSTPPGRRYDPHPFLDSLAAGLVAVPVLGLCSIALFFRQQIMNGFTVLSGDRFDGIIETSILEHWYNFWRGTAAFNVTNYFFPTPDTLGYNDGYFLYGAIYAVARALGANPFVASESVNISVLTIGYLAFTWCAAAVLRLSVPVAAFAGALFVLSGNMFIQLGHAQLLGVCFAPLLTTLIHRGLTAAVDQRQGKAMAYCAAGAALHAAWLMTTFYMAWYFLFAGLCFAVVAAVGSWRHLPAAWEVLRSNRFVALAGLVLYLLMNVPFLLTYLPTARETGQHRFDAVFVFIPSVLDIFNIGPDNLIFGRTYALLNEAIRPDFPDYGEKATGFPPILLLFFALGSVAAMVRRHRTGPDRLAMVMALAALTSWICILRIGDHTLWAWLYGVIPGAKTVRVVARYQIFLSFPVTLLAGYFIQTRSRASLTGATLIVLGLLVLEQIVIKPNVGLPVAEELSRLEDVPPAPEGCGSFYVSASREDSPDPSEIEGLYSHNVDAMMLAEYIGLPTVNGFSTFTPRDWNLTRPSERTRYLDDVKTYASQHGLKTLCGLDLHSLRWNADPFARP